MNKFLIAFDQDISPDHIIWNVMKLKNQTCFAHSLQIWIAESDSLLVEIVDRIQKTNGKNPIEESIFIQDLITRQFSFYKQPNDWDEWLTQRGIDLTH